MKWLTVLALVLPVHLASAGPIETEKSEVHEPIAAAGLHGIDVREFQTNINWATIKSKGNAFAYIQATEGIAYKNSHFGAQYSNATHAGLIRGAYHFARPDVSSGAAQAEFFIAHGGNWKRDGITLPGAVELTLNPSGPKCYGLSPHAMTAWVHDFSNTYHSKTSRYPVLYTNEWWTACTGDAKDFVKTNPVWTLNYTSAARPLPAGYRITTFWQYDFDATDGYGKDYFNGDEAALKRLALKH